MPSLIQTLKKTAREIVKPKMLTFCAVAIIGSPNLAVLTTLDINAHNLQNQKNDMPPRLKRRGL